MPLRRCQEDGKPGWCWGNQTCYTYTEGSQEGEMEAKRKAMAQAAAIRSSQRAAGKPVE